MSSHKSLFESELSNTVEVIIITINPTIGHNLYCPAILYGMTWVVSSCSCMHGNMLF